MKTIVVGLVWTLIVATVWVAAGEPQTRILGGGVTIEQATPIATLLAAPQDQAGKRVRIDGVITERDDMLCGQIPVYLGDHDSFAID